MLKGLTHNTFGFAAPILALALLFAAPAGSVDDREAKNAPDIVELATEGGFNTLVAAVKAGGLVETLKSEGPFTVFAPTDEAFAKLPEGTVEDLLKPENKEKLVSILTYHVVPARVPSGDVVKLSAAETAQGAEISIKTKDGKVMINDATVTTADLEASNGIVHVIDSVLMPPSKY